MEKNRHVKKNKGFTLIQLVILIAIFVMIVIISFPVFLRELERSLESTDFSTVRTVYAEFMADILSGDDDAVINDIPIKQADNTYRVAIYPLSQRMDGWTLRVDNKTIGDVPSSEWIGVPRKYGACIISYYPDIDKVTIHWGSGFPLMSLGQLHKIDDSIRVEEDQRLLQELGQQILKQYWTPEKLRETLELPEPKGDAKDSGDAIRIADYYQLKKDANTSDGFKITSTQSTKLEELLRSAGYEPGTMQFTKKKGKKQKDTTYQYSLFFSDELAANHYGGYTTEPARRSIFVSDIQVENDVISQLTIYTKAMDDQAVLSEEEEAQFRITINRIEAF